MARRPGADSGGRADTTDDDVTNPPRRRGRPPKPQAANYQYRQLTDEQQERLRNYPETIDDDEHHENLNSFVVAATDERGQSAKVSCNIPPGLMRQIEVILAPGCPFPYLTVSDLVRHAIVRQLNYLTRIAPECRDKRHFLSGMQAVNRIITDSLFEQQLAETRRRTVQRIEHHLQRGEVTDAIRIIGQIRREMSDVRDSVEKRQFMDWFSDTYGGFLRVNKSTKAIAASVTNINTSTGTNMDAYADTDTEGGATVEGEFE